MPKKKKGKELDDDIIIGYNIKKLKDNPPKKQKKKSKKKEIRREEYIERNGKPKKVSKKIPQKQVKQQTKKQTKKQKKRKQKVKKILKVLLRIAILIGILAGIILFLFVSPVFNIKEIEITGAEEISESVYKAMSGIDIDENIFSVNKSNIIKAIKQEPYVEKVEIKTIYPSKVKISITERKISYLAEKDGRYFYLDKNGYLLQTNLAPLDYLIIKGCTTDFSQMQEGERIDEKDIDGFNDLIKIVDAIRNNNIDTKLKSIDVTNETNYILELPDEQKIVMLGDTKDLSSKMAWINYFIKQNKNQAGTIYLNSEQVYFSPN